MILKGKQFLLLFLKCTNLISNVWVDQSVSAYVFARLIVIKECLISVVVFTNNSFLELYLNCILTWTKWLTMRGMTFRLQLIIPNNDMDTNAFSAVRTLSGSVNTYMANEPNETWNKKQNSHLKPQKFPYT